MLASIQVTWTVSHPGVLRIVHPFGPSVSETNVNRFAILLQGSSAGSATVKVSFFSYLPAGVTPSSQVAIHLEKCLGSRGTVYSCQTSLCWLQ